MRQLLPPFSHSSTTSLLLVASTRPLLSEMPASPTEVLQPQHIAPPPTYGELCQKDVVFNLELAHSESLVTFPVAHSRDIAIGILHILSSRLSYLLMGLIT